VIEPDPPKVNVEPVGSATHRVATVVGLIAIVFVVAIWKPWASPVAPTPAPQRKVAAAQTEAPATAYQSSAPTTPLVPPEIAAARDRMLCGDEPQWRLVTMESGSLGVVRTVYSDPPATATGPADQEIPTVPVTAGRLLGIGVCRPSQLAEQDGTSPVSGISIWQISALGTPSMIPGLAPVDIDLARVGEAYFRPDRSEAPLPTGASVDWVPARYVVEISAKNSPGQALWFALNFTTIQGSAGVPGQ
jgi:hypothetical protein